MNDSKRNSEKNDDDAFTAATCVHRVVCLFEIDYCTLCNRVLSAHDVKTANMPTRETSIKTE